MASRIELQSKLEELMGAKRVYYQPPDRMEYPAIKYSKAAMRYRAADNGKYLSMTRYEITVIASLPDNPVIEKILELPYSSYDRHYDSDNLNHDVITVYW